MKTINHKNPKVQLAIAALLVIALAAILFGTTGAVTLAAMLLFFLAAPYALLAHTSFDTDEKLFFALFLGIGLFSTALWFVGRVVPSLRLALVILLVLIVLASAALQFRSRIFPKNSSR